ncbi:unnamed protein product [Chrysoparadoxa australica]
MTGLLREAKISGGNWRTPMGLTVRHINVFLNSVSIKPRDVLRGAINFKKPAQGRAVLSLNDNDFAAFLVHPLLGEARLPHGGPFKFTKKRVSIHPEEGLVYFEGIWQNQPVYMAVGQPVPMGPFQVRVISADTLSQHGKDSLALMMTEYFDGVEMSMDGIDILLQDMSLMWDGQGNPMAVVMVKVGLYERKDRLVYCFAS